MPVGPILLDGRFGKEVALVFLGFHDKFRKSGLKRRQSLVKEKTNNGKSRTISTTLAPAIILLTQRIIRPGLTLGKVSPVVACVQFRLSFTGRGKESIGVDVVFNFGIVKGRFALQKSKGGREH